MPLRPLDNALPSAEQPKKVAKVAASPSLSAKKAAAALAAASRVNDENTPNPPPPEQSVEYVPSEDLAALMDPGSKIVVLLDELSSKDWIRGCEALNDLRRMALHHSSLLLPIFWKCGKACKIDHSAKENWVMIIASLLMIRGNATTIIVKAMKSPRSALCKTSIMASADIFQSFGALLLSSTEDNAFDQLLLQLLLKASQDKKFVCEEAEKALVKMAMCMPPLPLLKKLQSCVNHANLRVRAKAAISMSKCISKMDIEVMTEFGIATLLRVAAELLNDRLPEAREAARSIIITLHGEFSKNNNNLKDDKESSASESWQDFCFVNLPPIAAQSVAKIISL
ncbi:hypothetical protein ZIOFF_056358 [Zingiber officinale]|uniref:CLASP N-terminal domain-containing protein n=1 Tax=Zingiber officinale TaxID=94328 RepID=A0A8J5KFC4_ZINOF|nr:hypothetical protein ZIOFF_056358 [Zingiber officinale]